MKSDRRGFVVVRLHQPNPEYNYVIFYENLHSPVLQMGIHSMSTCIR